MRKSATLIFLLLTAAAPAAPSRHQQALMDRIEQAVVLPKGAKPLSAYGRNYARSSVTKVVATYLIPFPPIDASEGCEVMLESLGSRPCTKKELEKSAKSDARNVAAQTPAGQRRWYKSTRELPFIADGGCTQVTVEYNITTHHVVASCNGYA